MINTLKVKSRMVALGLTQKDIAICLEVSLSTVNLKLNNKRPMYLSEVSKLASLLEIEENEYHVYFFKNKVALCN